MCCVDASLDPGGRVAIINLVAVVIYGFVRDTSVGSSKMHPFVPVWGLNGHSVVGL